jgi:anion-transporting  ArsA/GET3 family ATPase
VSSDWSGVRLHVVTGKGGTGKSTVAASLALALASHGKDVLLCEVEGRQGIARMFDVDPLPYAERRIATGLRPATPASRPGVVHALHIDAEAALLEYLAMYYRLGRAGRALDRFGVIEFATTIAPGVRDVLLTGKVYEAVQRNSRNRGATEYDAVVLDAPPTGRITQFLNVSDELAGLAKVGPIKHQADTMMGLFRSPRTAVHFVTVLEEMPVQETADGIAHIREVGLPVGGVVVNQVRPRDLRVKDLAAARTGELDRAGVAADLAAAGVEVRDDLVDGLLARPATTPCAAPGGRPAQAGQGLGVPDLRAAAAGPGRRPGRALRARRRPARPGAGSDRPAPPGRAAGRALVDRPVLDVDALLDDPHTGIIVCCGSGGVGKTTTSAALALRAAERGRKVVVLTIDPARRLAQSMGIEELDNTPRPVPGLATESGGSLDAMMLDMKRTFDEVVESQASPEKARQILENPFYIALSSSFAGTQEYMAMEKLGQLRRDAQVAGTYDLIVVDTPPSRSALDFLDAPERLSSFLDGGSSGCCWRPPAARPGS